MSRQAIHQQLISYLYDEMSIEEKKAFEQEIEQNQSLKKELESLKQASEFFQQIEDHTPVQPLVLTPAQNPTFDWRQVLGNPWLQIAASVILLMLTAALIDLRISVAPRELRVQFGAPQLQRSTLTQAQWDSLQYVQQQQMKTLLSQQLNHQQDQWKQDLSSINQDLDQKWQQLTQAVQTLESREDTFHLSERQLHMLQNQLMQENYQMLTDLVEYSHEYHREYTTQLVTEFARYMEKQRVQDLEMISVALHEILEQNDIQQQETEYLLSRLISYVQQDQPLNQ